MPPQHGQLILFGDSVIQFSFDSNEGLGSRLRQHFTGRRDVINRGRSGFNSRDALTILPPIASSQNGADPIMAIMFGANDAVLSGYPQHISLEQYKTNLRTIITSPAITAHKTKVVLITPGPINMYQLKPNANTGLINRTADNTRKYAKACCEVGQQMGVPVVDTWSLFMRSAGWDPSQPLAGSKNVKENDALKSLLADGLHFSGAGYKLMFDEFMRVLKATWPAECP